MYKRLHHVTYDTRKGKHRSPLIRAQGAIRLIIPALCCPRSIMCVHCPASDSRISHRPSHGLTTQPPSQSRTHDSPTSQSRTHESATVPVTDSRLTYVPVTDSRLTHRPRHGVTTQPPSQSRSHDSPTVPVTDSRLTHRPSHGLTTHPPSQSRTHDSPTVPVTELSHLGGQLLPQQLVPFHAGDQGRLFVL